MPKRTDIKSILVIGAGPIIIGQACEFDYSGTQACLALREEGYRVILVNSNPATIMTDPGLSDATYIEPLTSDFIISIINKERPDAILPTMGGQTALNLAIELDDKGILAKNNIELIGASKKAINLAENRELFQKTMREIGLDVPSSLIAKNMEEALKNSKILGFPLIIRSSFTLGGTGSGFAFNSNDLVSLCEKAFQLSPNQELMLDEALIGWKEFEMEVVRDKNNNCIVVCSIENIDPLGIHTGDSITVSPAQTLTDKEYQKMRNASFDVLRAIGVETGGANVQFAIEPKTGRMVVIEMNPRVSRSSALASKATGFPIAKIAAKVAVGYTLDELKNDVTGSQIPASFEPVIDYVVVKIPYFQFEKFPNSQDHLGSQMQSVGEAMAIGRTFSEALLKAMRSVKPVDFETVDDSIPLNIPHSNRIWQIFNSFRCGFHCKDIQALTNIDPWFLEEIYKIVTAERNAVLSPEGLASLKKVGLADAQIGKIFKKPEREIRNFRTEWHINPVFKRVDSCSAEFATSTAYSYATYEQSCEANPTRNPKILIIGSGPNRIGQGIEFDYSCVHAVKTLSKLNYETIMVNCNPETVSTDYDCADRLYCSPLTIEDLLPILEREKPLGILLQFGGQTSLNLAKELEENGQTLLGFDTHLISVCENRETFRQFLNDLKLQQPHNITVFKIQEELSDFSYPLIIRPSFILGGCGMSIVNNREELYLSLQKIFKKNPDYPVLIEHFLNDAIEIDVDAISDGKDVFIPAIMEQVEPAGTHSGDSATYLPTRNLSQEVIKNIKNQTKKIALKLNIKGIINIQFAVQGDTIFVLEVNPRASRTLPFLSKALGLDLVRISIHCILGGYLSDFPLLNKTIEPKFYFVKEAVFPSLKFGEFALNAEMKSTGEVMGIGLTFNEAYNKAQLAAGHIKEYLNDYRVLSLQDIYELSYGIHE